jgi:uncharacterized protein
MVTASDAPLGWVDVRLYADLADLAGAGERTVPVGAPRSVKDVIEACGVPHTELGLVLVDQHPVGFDHRLTGGERVAAYPPFHHLDLGDTTTVLPPPIAPRFVLDVHLGTLTRRLRLLGFDAWYRTDTDDHELAAVAVEQQRILLTRDRKLLMRRVITHGYCPRSDDPEHQAIEVVRRFELGSSLAPFTRCVTCNGLLRRVTRAEVVHLLPPRTRTTFDTFTRCTECGQVYWPGSHVDAVDEFVSRARAATGRPDPATWASARPPIR